MSSVEASGRRRSLGGGGGVASGSATARQSYYHCYNCDRMVTLIAAGQLVCPTCHGVVLEELVIPPTPPSSPPRGSRNSYDCILSLFRTAGFESESDSDSDLELSCPLPPPRPSFTTNTDFSYSDSDLNFSEPLPPPPPPPPLQFPISSRTARDRLEIDFSEHLPDIDNHFSILPPPPPPPPTIVPDRTVRGRLPQTIPPPPPSLNTWDYFPVEPVRWSTSMSAISTMMEEEEMLLHTKVTEEMMLGRELTQCAVCMDNIEVNQLVMQMPCKHMYHSDCISPWLESHDTCPVCRSRLNPNTIY
ncbi:hypothetical protein ACH5RR_018861 [Cinchona calisaya]|uniref:RING-type E3 ubiquitin transferase n=1 Tax=Cinchona calisaya TaxID=153742 RepID=A0ABD2ZRB9_9GENT